MEQIEKGQRTDIRDKIIDFVRNNFLMGDESVKLEENDSFLEKGIVDSTGILELVGFVEESFGFRVEDEELMPENFDSLRNISSFVLRKLSDDNVCL